MSEPRKIEDAEGELSSIHDLIEEAYNAFECLRDAASLGDQAAAVIRLSNVMSDMATWHPRWNSDRGWIEEADEV